MPRMEAEACIRELKIQKLEIDRAERMGQLMHTELVQAFITEQIGAWRIELEALPARLSRDRAERSRINAEVEKVIDRIVAKAEGPDGQAGRRGGRGRGLSQGIGSGNQLFEIAQKVPPGGHL